jgi:RNA polymerase sigma-70 factor (ECF subfamily)
MPLDGTGHVSTEELFRKHAGFVARFLARLGVPPDHAEDALQEVFLVVHRHGGYRPGIAKPTSYLASIAIRAAAQHRRRQAVASTRSSEASVELIASETGDPAHALQAHEDIERFQLALQRLPEDLRTTLLLVEVEGESCISVAAGLGCPVGTIYWRLHQARKKLQSTLATLKAARRAPRTQPGSAPLDERAVPLGSLSMFAGLFDFRSTEWARVLRVVREQRAEIAPTEELLARHRQLVQSGAELPAWASGWAPHSASWLSVVGLGPIVVGVAAIGAVTAALLFSPNAEPPVKPHLEAPPVNMAAAPAEVEAPEITAPAAASEPAPAAEKRPAVIAPPRQRFINEAPARLERPVVRRESTSTTSPTAINGDFAEALPVEERVAANDEPKEEVAPPQPPPKEPLSGQDRTLAEMREIAQAERLLSTNPAQALELTRSMRERFEVGYFAEERGYVEVMALHRLGRTDELRDKGAAYLRAYPSGPYAERVRKALASASTRK